MLQILWSRPLADLCFFALIMGTLSLWICRSPWIWGGFLLIALVLASLAALIQPIALLPIAALFLIHRILILHIQGWKRIGIFLIACAISLGLSSHLLPGFHNWQLASNLVLSSEALPYSLWLNFDKPFMGFFALAYSIPLIQSRIQLKEVSILSVPLTLLGIAMIGVIATYGGIVAWDPKVPGITPIWMIANLFLVTIPEEAFFRGFLQEEIFRWLGSGGARAQIGSVLLTSFFFTLLHVYWISSIPFLAFVFIASLIYGGIYQYTKAIESSIFCHFALNLVHFLFFTYPALKTVL